MAAPDWLIIIGVIMNIFYLIKVYLHFKIFITVNKNITDNIVKAGCSYFNIMLPIFLMTSEEELKIRKWKTI